MTNFEALRAKVVYPLEDSTIELALIDRGLDATGDYLVANKRVLELAQADCLIVIINSPTISEEGFQLSHTNKGELIKVAQGLYKKWGEADPFETKIEDITDQW